MNDKELIPLCKRLAARFVRQAGHLGAREDVFDELVNVAYVAGREGRYILWELIHYVVLPSNDVGMSGNIKRKRGAFRTADLRRNARELDEPSPLKLLEEKDDKRKAFDLMTMLSPDDLVLICLYFGREKSYKDIGRIFERSGWWVSLRIKSILENLRKEMGG